jgi:hypothetical protein
MGCCCCDAKSEKSVSYQDVVAANKQRVRNIEMKAVIATLKDKPDKKKKKKNFTKGKEPVQHSQS